MNILSQLDRALNSQVKSIALITGQRSGGLLVAQTESGASILLKGEMDTGKKVYYDMTTSRVLEEAPNVNYSEYGV